MNELVTRYLVRTLRSFTGGVYIIGSKNYSSLWYKRKGKLFASLAILQLDLEYSTVLAPKEAL